MLVKQLCTKNSTRGKTTIPLLQKLVPRRNIVHKRPPPPPWQRRKKMRTAAIPRSRRAPSHTKMLFEPLKRVAASDETESLWHVGRGSSPWSPDLDAVNFIRCSRRRGTSPLAVIHAPNCKTVNTTTAADTTATRESAVGRPPDTNLAGSRDRQDDQATCPPTPPVAATTRWRKSRGKLFRRGATSSMETTPQESTRPTLTTDLSQSTRVPTPSGRQSGGRRRQGPAAAAWRPVWLGAYGMAPIHFSRRAGSERKPFRPYAHQQWRCLADT
jgi:hypothetical protein